MEKKNGFILYFDVLGYKNIVQNNTDEENCQIASILEHFSKVYSIANSALGYGSNLKREKLKVRCFSDNFLIFYELERNDYEGLRIFQLVATRIQYQFLTVGLLTRGSISFGEAWFSDTMVFGAGIIHAVELEEGHRMPSIVNDKSLSDVFDNTPFDFQEEVDLFDVWPNSKLDYDDCINGIIKYLTFLNKSHADNSTLEKIRWVIDRLNRYFEKDQKTHYELDCNYKYSLIKSEGKI